MKLNGLAHSVRVALLTSSALSFTVQAADISEAETSAVEKIVVTGQKFDTTLQETPASVAVLTTESLDKLDARSLSEVFQHIPNVTGGDAYNFTVRGINWYSVSGGGNSYLASVYLDGAPLPYRVLATGGITDLWDINQIEVLRGAQSTLQGRNALAGAVVLRSTDPSYEWSGKTRVTLGDYGQQSFAGAIGGAIIDNQLAFRISGQGSSKDGYSYNTVRMEDAGYRENDNLRAKLLFEPEAIPGLRAILTHSKDSGEVGTRYVTTSDPEGPREVAFDAPIREMTDTTITSFELSYELADEWTFYYTGTSSDADYAYDWDGDFSPEPISILRDDRNDKTISHELRFTFDYDVIRGVFGGYYSDLDAVDASFGGRSISLQALGVPALLTAPPAFGGLGLPADLAAGVLSFYGAVDPVQLDTINDSAQNVTSQAVFADMTYRMTNNLDLIFGFRYDEESVINDADSYIDIANADKLPNPAAYQSNPQIAALLTGLNAQLFQQAADASADSPSIEASFDAFLPKLGFNYFWNDTISTSFIYQQGYRSGGVGYNIARAEGFDYKAEYTDNYEVSLRSVWLDGDLVLNANLYWLDWTDQQVNINLSSNQYDVITTNAGKSELKGFETELFLNVSDNWRITAGLGLAKTEFIDFVAAGVDLTGTAFADAPEWTANLASQYQFDSGLYLNLNLNYTDESLAILNPSVWYESYDGMNSPMNDDRLLMNAQIGYDWGNVKVWADFKNVFDQGYVEVFREDDETMLGAPRRFSISLEAKF